MAKTKKISVWSKERGLRTLKEGVTLQQYQQKFPTAIKVTRPSLKQLEYWSYDSVCEAVDGCMVEPDGHCEHGYPSWLMAEGIM